MLALSRFFYVVAGSCALYVSLAPFFSSWRGSPSLFSLAYWICAVLLLIAATLRPSENSATLGVMGSSFLTMRLGFRLTRSVACKLGLIHASARAIGFPPKGFDRVNHIMKMPVAITLLISSFASLLISAVILWRLRNHTSSPRLAESSGK
ncbi:MAG: hypothetical protein JWO71_3403 [Candidatus Acidoferrum typicum]|nr:hypothetical protein [Candidatus Acidoferrum typicum]